MRRYPQFEHQPNPSPAFASEGQAPITVVRRRYPQFEHGPDPSPMFQNIGTPAGSGGGFQSAWAIGSNVILQSGVN